MVVSFGEVLMDCFPDKNVIGGAPFNVVTHLKRLGVDAAIISKIGNDKLGAELLTFLQNEKTDSMLQIDNDFPTGSVTVTLNNGQPSYKIHSGTGWENIDFVPTKIKPDYFVFGSLSLYFPENKHSFEQYIKLYSSSIKVCDINLRQPFYNNDSIEFCLKNCDILKINDEELEYLGKHVFNVSNPLSYLADVYHLQKIILTKGGKGAELYWGDEHYSCSAGKVDNLKDTVGAGDAFTSHFIFGLIKKLKLEENLKKSSDFAAKICETNGAIPPDKNLYLPFK